MLGKVCLCVSYGVKSTSTPGDKILNPLDALCNVPRTDAICVSNLNLATITDPATWQDTPDVKIFLPFRFYNFKPLELYQPNTYITHLVAPGADLVNSLVDNISYRAAPSPPISQLHDIPPEVFCNSDNIPPYCTVDCACTHMIDVPLNALVEIVLIDEVSNINLSHPFHLHGYSYRVMGMGRSPDKGMKRISLKHVLDLDRKGLLNRQNVLPPGKDTVPVPNNGYVVLRLRANNPGYWLLHCHFVFHLVVGMGTIIHVGNQSDLPPVPPNFPTCGNYRPEIIPPIPNLYGTTIY